MNTIKTLMALAITLLCVGCHINAGNGLFIYESQGSHLGAYSDTTTNAEGQVIGKTWQVGTRGLGTEAKAQGLTVRELLIERLKRGETIDNIAKSLGVDAEALREMIE